MQFNQSLDPAVLMSASDQTLHDIVEAGFFTMPGSLTVARAACAELIFARYLIEAQTAEIESLRGALQREAGTKNRARSAEVFQLRADPQLRAD